MQPYDIALILAAACALATFSARDLQPAASPDRQDTVLRTAMAPPDMR